MRSACYRVIWGLLFVLIDLKVEFVDVLPDMLGYLLIASGLWRLQSLNGYFRIGHLSAWLLLVWSAVSLFWFPEAGNGSVHMQSDKDLFTPLPGVILYTALIYGICRGIQAHSTGTEAGLDRKASFRLQLFMALQLLWLIMYPFVLNLDSGVMLPVIFICSLMMIFAEITVLFLVRSAGREWEEERDQGH